MENTKYRASPVIVECAPPTSKNFQNLTGNRYGRLLVLGFFGRSATDGSTFFTCLCDCGKTVQVVGYSLKRGMTKSCGCFLRDSVSERNATHRLSGTSIYNSWATMIRRCEDPKHQNYCRYGAVGVRVSDAWKSFDQFFKDVGPKPGPAYSLDRIDGNKGYEAGNVRWATKKEQSRNRRDNVMVTFRGETKCLGEWAEIMGFKHPTILGRLRRGWTPERAFTEAIRSHYRSKPYPTTGPGPASL